MKEEEILEQRNLLHEKLKKEHKDAVKAFSRTSEAMGKGSAFALSNIQEVAKILGKAYQALESFEREQADILCVEVEPDPNSEPVDYLSKLEVIAVKCKELSDNFEAAKLSFKIAKENSDAADKVYSVAFTALRSAEQELRLAKAKEHRLFLRSLTKAKEACAFPSEVTIEEEKEN